MHVDQRILQQRHTTQGNFTILPTEFVNLSTETGPRGCHPPPHTHTHTPQRRACFSGLTMKLMRNTIDTSGEEFLAVLTRIYLYSYLFVLLIIHTVHSFTVSFQVQASHNLFAN